MLKDILTLMLAIVLSFTTGGSVQDEKMNDRYVFIIVCRYSL